MSILSRWMPAAAILFALPLATRADDAPTPPAEVDPAQAALAAWPVASAPARFTIEPDSSETQPALSTVSLCFPDPHWAAMTVAFYTESGARVGSQLVWTSPGGPSTFVFDSSSNSRRYQVYVGSANWPPKLPPDTKSGVWLETRAGDGQVIARLPDMLAAWNKSTEVVGRAVLIAIDEGGNRFGPLRPLLLHFQGTFDVKDKQPIELATVSTDSSFVLVDGREVVNWPGHHGWGYDGNLGPPQGSVDVAPGAHTIDYYNAYMSPNNDPPLMACLAVKGGPFADFTLLAPDKPFFRPVFRDHIVSYELQGAPGSTPPRGVPQLAINWTNEEQCFMSSELPDCAMVALQFTCLNAASSAIVNWTFDDGATATGPSVKHIFLRPGLRTVRVTLKDGEREIATIDQPVDVHLDWPHPDKRPDLNRDLEAELLKRDPMTLSGPDLSNCFAILGFYGEKDALLKILPALVAKMKDVPETDLPLLKNAAAFLVHEDPGHVTEEMQLLHALVDRAATIKQPIPVIATAIDELRLLLAQLTLELTDHLDEVKALADLTDPSGLNGDKHNELKILRADLALASGDIDGARRQYDALARTPTGPDERSLIRRTAKIDQARAYIEAGDYVAAQDALHRVIWQNPADRLAPDWALTQIRLYQEEGWPVAAYLCAKRLLPVINDSGRSELLYRMTDLAFAQKDDALAAKSLSELLQKHPYSEEAALAKQKWPGKS